MDNNTICTSLIPRLLPCSIRGARDAWSSRGHGEELKTISEVAYQWEKLVFVMGLNYPDTEKIKLETNGAEKACLSVFIL